MMDLVIMKTHHCMMIAQLNQASSHILVLGCFDADGDGYDDITDDCNTVWLFLA